MSAEPAPITVLVDGERRAFATMAELFDEIRETLGSMDALYLARMRATVRLGVLVLGAMKAGGYASPRAVALAVGIHEKTARRAVGCAREIATPDGEWSQDRYAEWSRRTKRRAREAGHALALDAAGNPSPKAMMIEAGIRSAPPSPSLPSSVMDPPDWVGFGPAGPIDPAETVGRIAPPSSGGFGFDPSRYTAPPALRLSEPTDDGGGPITGEQLGLDAMLDDAGERLHDAARELRGGRLDPDTAKRVARQAAELLAMIDAARRDASPLSRPASAGPPAGLSSRADDRGPA